MRDIGLGALVFVLLLVAAAPSTFAARQPATVPTASPSPSLIGSGPGFTVCGADESWRRPTEMEQRAHFAGDNRFTGLWETPETTGYREFRAPAVLYDGTSADGLHYIMHFTGLWNVWDDPATRPKTCWTPQPQVFLFGYEPVRYDAQDPSVAVLKVRAASGYRIVVLTGPIRALLRVVADRKLDELAVPPAWVTPAR